jgi:hypothetical protein
MASIKRTQNCGGIFPKLKVTLVFFKYANIVVASIQLTPKKNDTIDTIT